MGLRRLLPEIQTVVSPDWIDKFDALVGLFERGLEHSSRTATHRHQQFGRSGRLDSAIRGQEDMHVWLDRIRDQATAGLARGFRGNKRTSTMAKPAVSMLTGGESLSSARPLQFSARMSEGETRMPCGPSSVGDCHMAGCTQLNGRKQANNRLVVVAHSHSHLVPPAIAGNPGRADVHTIETG